MKAAEDLYFPAASSLGYHPSDFPKTAAAVMLACHDDVSEAAQSTANEKISLFGLHLTSTWGKLEISLHASEQGHTLIYNLPTKESHTHIKQMTDTSLISHSLQVFFL